MSSVAPISKRILPSIRPTSLHLYTTPYSGCSARVRITTALKKIPEKIKMEYHRIDYSGGEHQKEAYKKLNPNMSLPTMVIEYSHYLDGEQPTKSSMTITQSLAILDWIEHQFPDPALIPPVKEDDPSSWARRARAWELASLVTCDIQPPQSGRIRKKIEEEFGIPGDGKGEEWARWVYERGLGVYERLLGSSGTTLARKERYSVGDSVTLADVCLVPAAQGAMRVGLELGRWPLVKEVVDECWKLEEFRKAGLGEHGRLDP